MRKKLGGIAFLGSPPAILGGPQRNPRKFCSGIVDGLNWVRLGEEANQWVKGLRCRRRCSSFDGTDGPSNSNDPAVPHAFLSGFP